MLVRESLYNFKRESDPIESSALSQRKLIEEWLETYDIENYIIRDDLTIDVKYNDVRLEYETFEELPPFIQFNKIEKDFNIQRNKLKTLRGCPIEVEGDFKCYQNYLTSLEYAPEFVGGDFICWGNDKPFTKREVENVSVVNGKIKITDYTY